jgi:hypothetical protein
LASVLLCRTTSQDAPRRPRSEFTSVAGSRYASLNRAPPAPAGFLLLDALFQSCVAASYPPAQSPVKTAVAPTTRQAQYSASRLGGMRTVGGETIGKGVRRAPLTSPRMFLDFVSLGKIIHE